MRFPSSEFAHGALSSECPLGPFRYARAAFPTPDVLPPNLLISTGACWEVGVARARHRRHGWVDQRRNKYTSDSG